MRFSSVLRNFLIIYFVLHFGLVSLFLLIVTQSQRDRMLEQTQQRMFALAVSIRESVSDQSVPFSDPKLPDRLNVLSDETGMRFTMILADGTVVADTMAKDKVMENHGDRPEVLEAATNRFGTDRRTSATVDVSMFYMAVRLEDAETGNLLGYVRVAAETESIDNAIASLTRFTWIFASVLALVAGVLTWFILARQMMPLSMFANAARKAAAGDYTQEISSAGHRDEWADLAKAFEKMQTDLAKRESSLTESNRRFESIFTTISDGLVVVDPQGYVVSTNRAARELLGLSAEETVGKSIVEAVRIPAFQSTIEAAVVTRSIQKKQFETINEPRRSLYVKVTPVSGEGPSGMILAIHDRTELEQLSTMRTDFVASVSHELKTPLASIRAYAETLRMCIHDEPEHAERFLSQIEVSADQLNQQIQDLLQIARIESGRETFENENVNLHMCFLKSVETHQHEAENRNIDIQISSQNSAIHAYADVEAVQTMVDNLVSNAIRYARPSGQIQLTSYQRDRSAVFEVTDNGIGIAPQYHERVFERFFRVDKARSRDLGGTGLGLSIVKHLAQSFGGTVELDSAVGRGSTFRVVLPQAQVNSESMENHG